MKKKQKQKKNQKTKKQPNFFNGKNVAASVIAY